MLPKCLIFCTMLEYKSSMGAFLFGVILMVEYPFASVATTPTETELLLFKEYAWDFDNDSFIYDDNGNHILLEGNEAIKVWCYKALKTERFMYLAYSRNYGIELYPFMAKVMSIGQRKSELKRMVTECLMTNPYIVSVDSIIFNESNRNENMEITIVLTTIYGELVI